MATTAETETKQADPTDLEAAKRLVAESEKPGEVEPVDPGLAALPEPVPPSEVSDIEIFGRTWQIDRRVLAFSAKEEAAFQAANAVLLKLNNMREKKMSDKLIEKVVQQNMDTLSITLSREYQYGQKMQEAMIDPDDSAEFDELWSTVTSSDGSPIGSAITLWKASNNPKS